LMMRDVGKVQTGLELAEQHQGNGRPRLDRLRSTGDNSDSNERATR
jgi:hypothetical protein